MGLKEDRQVGVKEITHQSSPLLSYILCGKEEKSKTVDNEDLKL